MSLTLVEKQESIKEPDLTYVMTAQAQFCDGYQVKKDPETIELYFKLIDEEHEEWIEEFYGKETFEFDELKELCDLLYVTAGLAHIIGYDIKKGSLYTGTSSYDYAITELVTEIVSGNKDKKTLTTLMYCIYAYANAMGWDIDTTYKRVHLSNLSKLGDDGKPIYREDGKILKGPRYKPPFLEDLTDGK